MEEFPYPIIPTELVIYITLTITLVVFIYFRNSSDSILQVLRKRSRIIPEPADSWPILGHLPLLGGPYKLLHRVFESLFDRLGPVFSIHLGSNRALVINTWEATKECFKVHEGVFMTRPRYLVLQIMGYVHAIFGVAPYGPYWRGMMKLAVLWRLLNYRLKQFPHVRDTETRAFLVELYKEWSRAGGKGPVKVEMKGRFGNLTMRMVVGKRYTGAANEEESWRCQKAMDDFFYWVEQFLISDSISFLRWINVITVN